MINYDLPESQSVRLNRFPLCCEEIVCELKNVFLPLVCQLFLSHQNLGVEKDLFGLLFSNI